MQSMGAFNLDDTIVAVVGAFKAVFCHVCFVGALHGLIMALILGFIGFILYKRKHRLGTPFMSVCRRLSMFCGIVMIPGLITLITAGQLPSTGVFSINSMGFICFWSLICVHLSAEEMNYRWF